MFFYFYFLIGFILSCFLSKLVIKAAVETVEEQNLNKDTTLLLYIFGIFCTFVFYPLFITYIIFKGVTLAFKNSTNKP